MRKTRYVTCCIALAAAAVVTAAMPARAATENERALIAILQSDAPKKDKAITCKKLAVFGSQQAVPALAALLPDKELTSWARIALEAIPGPAADKALREALGKVQGRVLIGVINSIGVRRDANAVDDLKSQLHNNNAQVAAAAALALGRIGNPPATRVLAQSLASAPGDVRSAVAEGCVLCAERLLADGKAKAAVRLYDKVRQADVPKQRVVEATRGAILARQPAGIELLAEQLKSTDKVMFALGLTTARELPGRKVTKALAAELDKASPHRQAMLLLSLADRSDDPDRVVDAHFRMVGPVVRQLQQVFLEDWSFVTGHEPDRFPADCQEAGSAKCRTIVEGPDEDLDKLLAVLVGAVSAARRQVAIMTPYFIPPRELVGALQAAALRGVKVTVILPAKNNLPFVHWASTNMLWEMLQRGVRVFLQPPPFVHTKLFLVDGHYVQVGSANMDPRSLRLNFELVVEIYDRDFATTIGGHFEAIRKRSREVTLEAVDGRRLPLRLRIERVKQDVGIKAGHRPRLLMVSFSTLMALRSISSETSAKKFAGRRGREV